MSNIKDNEVQWRSIFESVQALTERNRECKKDALKKAIIEKEKTVKRLYLNNLGIPKYLYTEKPLSLKKMEKGLQNYFFGRTGEITKRFAFIRKEIWRKEKKRQENLEKKIDTGPLTYFFLKENEDTFEKKVSEVKKHKLKTSLNYVVKDDKDLNLNIEQLRLIEQLGNSLNDSNTLHTLNNSNRRTISKALISKAKKRNMTPNGVEIKNRKSVLAMTPNNSRNNPKIPSLFSNPNTKTPKENKSSFTSRNRPSKDNFQPLYYPYKTFLTQTNTRKIRHSLDATKSLLLFKAHELGNTQEKLEKTLFKIIDEANTGKKEFIPQGTNQDLEEIFDMKAKKKNKQGEAKEMVIQAIKLKDDYTQMDRDKAEMLKLSDEITRMSDEAALLFAEKIQEAYSKRSGKIEENEYKINPHIEKMKKLKILQLRTRVNQGMSKIKKMSFNLEYEKSNLNKKYPNK